MLKCSRQEHGVATRVSEERRGVKEQGVGLRLSPVALAPRALVVAPPAASPAPAAAASPLALDRARIDAAPPLCASRAAHGCEIVSSAEDTAHTATGCMHHHKRRSKRPSLSIVHCRLFHILTPSENWSRQCRCRLERQQGEPQVLAAV
jgi:hypothetical protein